MLLLEATLGAAAGARSTPGVDARQRRRGLALLVQRRSASSMDGGTMA
jgi:hypothetical protein